MNGVTEAMMAEREGGSWSVMMETGIRAAIGSNAKNSYWTEGSAGRQKSG